MTHLVFVLTGQTFEIKKWCGEYSNHLVRDRGDLLVLTNTDNQKEMASVWIEVDRFKYGIIHEKK